MECQALRCRPPYFMRRLAFLAAASLAFIAISEPPSAGAKRTQFDSSENRRCRDACYTPGIEYYQMSEKDQKKWSKCINNCDRDFPEKKSNPRTESCKFNQYHNRDRCDDRCRDECRRDSRKCWDEEQRCKDNCRDAMFDEQRRVKACLCYERAKKRSDEWECDRRHRR